MLKGKVLHPEILSAIGSAGHLSKVLISDGNYPHSTVCNPRAKIVWYRRSRQRIERDGAHLVRVVGAPVGLKADRAGKQALVLLRIQRLGQNRQVRIGALAQALPVGARALVESAVVIARRLHHDRKARPGRLQVLDQVDYVRKSLVGARQTIEPSAAARRHGPRPQS